MGEVILGLPGPWADNKLEVSDHYTTKIGGLPDWPIPNARPDLLSCDACGNNLALVAQVYVPISSSTLKIEERVIYVFGCVMTKCASTPVSWKALRIQKLFSGNSNATSTEVVPSTIFPHSASASKVTEDLWTFDSEEDDDIDLEELSRAFSEAASLASHPKKQSSNSNPEATVESSTVTRTRRVINANVPVLPCFYIYTQVEALSNRSAVRSTSCSSLSVKEKQSDTDDHSPEEMWEVEGYEYDRALNADRTYLKFKKRIDTYPEQCFRYSYGGKPLLATGGVADPGLCKLCGGPRHYEMQLMPPLLYFLQEEGLDSKDHSLDNWNWMTVVVYTCAASCTDSNHDNSEGWTFAEEEVVIQYE